MRTTIKNSGRFHRRLPRLARIFIIQFALASAAFYTPPGHTDPIAEEIELEALLANHSNSFSVEEIKDFTKVNRYFVASIPVGQLEIRFEKTTDKYACTASLIAENLVLTAAHCLKNKKDETDRVLQFVLVMDFTDNRDNSDRFSVSVTPLEKDDSLDYAILRVTEAGRDPARNYGTVKMSKNELRPSEEIFIIHHPWGKRKMVTRRYCRVRGSSYATAFAHLCHTEQGSSGGPIFEENQAVPKVIGMHLGHNKEINVNRATPMISLIKSSCLLTQISNNQTADIAVCNAAAHDVGDSPIMPGDSHNGTPE